MLGLLAFVISTSVLAQITDPEQAKSWFFLQKIATDIEELWNCHGVALMQHDADAPRYATAAYEKTTLFVHEADAYVQRYVSRRGKTETPEAFRFRVWKVPIQAGASKARPIEELSPLCSALLP